MSEDIYKEIFSKNLKHYMAINGKTQTDLINDLDLNKSAVSTWCNGTRLPRMDKVDALAKYFGINRSDLIEDKSSFPEVNTLAAHFEGEEFTEAEMEEIKNFVEFVKNKRKQSFLWDTLKSILQWGGDFLNQLEQLESEACEDGIKVVDYSFDSPNIKGLYCDGVVGISDSLENSTQKRCVLAEEIGHHHTSNGNILTMSSASNRQQEHRARLWGYQKLIDLDSIIAAYENHCTNFYETAEFLNVTEQFLADTINAYMHKYGCYIKHKNYIIEFGYNSVGVIKNF